MNQSLPATLDSKLAVCPQAAELTAGILESDCGLLCRLLNELPATRLTATALEAFLKVAGYRLYAAFRSQFVRLLHFVDQVFLVDLRKVRTQRFPGLPVTFALIAPVREADHVELLPFGDQAFLAGLCEARNR